MLIELPSGTPIFMNYLTHVPEWYQVVWTGNAKLEQPTPTEALLTVEPGDSTIAVVSGWSIPALSMLRKRC